MLTTASQAGIAAVVRSATRNVACGARSRARAIIADDTSNPYTVNPAAVSRRASSPEPQPISTTVPFVMSARRRMLITAGATRREKSPNAVSWMNDRWREYKRRIIDENVARSHLADALAHSRRHWLRSVRLRQKAGTLAAAGRGPRPDGVSLFHAGR